MRAALLPSSIFAILLSSVPAGLCDVVFTSPTPGQSVTGGSTFTVTWKESGVAPLITDLTTYQLFLFTGGNAAPFQLWNLKDTPTPFTSGSSVTVSVPVTVGGPGTNV